MDQGMITRKISIFLLLFCCSTSCKAQFTTTSDLYESFVFVSDAQMEYFESIDSISRKETTYLHSKIYGARIQFIHQKRLFAEYSKFGSVREIYDVTSTNPMDYSVISYVFYGEKLVIYYSDFSDDVNSIVCDVCSVNLDSLVSKEQFIIHSKIIEGEIIVEEVGIR